MPRISQKGISLLLLVIIIAGILALILAVAGYLNLFPLKQNKPEQQPHSLVTSDGKEPVEVNPGESISGKGIPLGKNAISLSPGDFEQTVETDKDGNWVLQLPKELKSDTYRVNILIMDKTEALILVKSYHIKVNESFFKSSLNILKIDEAYAQGLDQLDPVWVTQMQTMGFYPAVEDDEIVFYNRETFVDKYCPNQCFLNHPSTQELISNVEGDADFISLLVVELIQTDYSAYDALEEYYPDIKDFYRQNANGMEPPFVAGSKHISEEDLVQAINSVAQKKGWTKATSEEYFGDPFKTFVTLTDPIFGTGAIISVLTLPPNKVTNEQRLNAVLGITMLAAPVGKFAIKGLQLTSKSAVAVKQIASDMAIFRRAVQSGEAVEYEAVVNGRAQAWHYNRKLPPSRYGPGTQFTRTGPVPFPKNPNALARFNRSFANLVNTNYLTSVSRTEVLYPARDNMMGVVDILQKRLGRQVAFDRNAFFRAIENAQVYVVDDFYYDGGTSAAYALGDMVIIKRSVYEGRDGLFILQHELTHLTGGAGGRINKGFVYKGQTDRDKLFSGMFELMTDNWADTALGNSPLNPYTKGVASGYPEIYSQTFNGLYHRVFKQNPNMLDYFLEFAITGDADALVTSVVGQKGKFLGVFGSGTPDYAAFERIFKQGYGVNFRAIVVTGGVAGAGGAEAISSPSYEVGDDFLIDDYDPTLVGLAPSVTILDADGPINPGGTIRVASALSADGNQTDTDPFRTTWTIENPNTPTIVLKSQLIPEAKANFIGGALPGSVNGIRALMKNTGCDFSCELTLPTNLGDGEVTLNVYLTRKDSDTVLSADSLILNPTSTQANPDLELCNAENPSKMEFARCKENACGIEVWKCPDGSEYETTHKCGPCGIDDGEESYNASCKDGAGHKRKEDESPIPLYVIKFGDEDSCDLSDIQHQSVVAASELNEDDVDLGLLIERLKDSKDLELKKLAQLAYDQTRKQSKVLRECVQ